LAAKKGERDGVFSGKKRPQDVRGAGRGGGEEMSRGGGRNGGGGGVWEPLLYVFVSGSKGKEEQKHVGRLKKNCSRGGEGGNLVREQ